MFYDITSNYKWIKSIMCHSFINELLLLWYKWNYTLQTIRLYDNNPPRGSNDPLFRIRPYHTTPAWIIFV